MYIIICVLCGKKYILQGYNKPYCKLENWK